MAGQDEFCQVQTSRTASVVLYRAVQSTAPGFAGFKLVRQAIGQASRLEFEAMYIDPLTHAMEDNEIAPFRPRRGIVVKKME